MSRTLPTYCEHDAVTDWGDFGPEGDRVPPHNRDAEAALISSCLVSPNALHDALTVVAPDDLYVPANRRTWAAICRLHTRGDPIDPITVADEIQTGEGRPGIDPADVVAYLTSLGTVANTPAYARIVADMARYRRLLAAADELAAAVARFDDTAIDQAVKAIAAERAA